MIWQMLKKNKKINFNEQLIFGEYFEHCNFAIIAFFSYENYVELSSDAWLRLISK